MKNLDVKYIPFDEEDVVVVKDDDYNGAHYYEFKKTLGFNPNTGLTEFIDFAEDNNVQSIQFVHKSADDQTTAGITSEQLLCCLMDRHRKLDAQFPHFANKLLISYLKLALDACHIRYNERLLRGVMGKLEK